MHKDVVRVIKHFRVSLSLKLLNVFIVLSLIPTILTGLLSAFSQADGTPFKLCSAVTLTLIVVGFAFSCKKIFLEKSSVQLLNTKILEKFSIDENFNLLMVDKKIHEELLRFCPTDKIREHENARYTMVRFNHFLAWFGKNLSNVKMVSASPEFNGDVRNEFCKMQHESFKALLELCADNEEMMANIRKGEAYVKELLVEYEVV